MPNLRGVPVMDSESDICEDGIWWETHRGRAHVSGFKGSVRAAFYVAAIPLRDQDADRKRSARASKPTATAAIACYVARPL